MDGLAHGIASGWVVYVCSEDQESDPLLLRKERSYISDRNAGVEAEMADGCNCTIFTC